jgi:hypothetical protein
LREKEALRIAFVILVASSLTASAQNSVLTNEQVVIGSVREAVLESRCCSDLGDIHLSLAKTGVLRPVSYGLADGLRLLGNSVSTEVGKAPIDIDYDLLGFDFAYHKGSSQGFMHKPMIKRVLDARIRISARRTGDGAILKTDELTVAYADEVDPESAYLIRSLDIPELSPDPPGSRWSKIVEPVVVTAAVGGLVYLFFANR